MTISSGDASVALYTNLWLRKAFRHPDCTEETRQPTAIASVTLLSLLMGFVYMLVGHYHAADLVRWTDNDDKFTPTKLTPRPIY